MITNAPTINELKAHMQLMESLRVEFLKTWTDSGRRKDEHEAMAAEWIKFRDERTQPQPKKI